MTPEEQSTLRQLIKNIKSCYNKQGVVITKKGGFFGLGGSYGSKEDKLDGYIADLVDFSSKASENNNSTPFADFIMTVADELIHNKKGVAEESTVGIKRSNRVSDFKDRLAAKFTEKQVPLDSQDNVFGDIEKRLNKLFDRKPQVEMISNPAYNSPTFGENLENGRRDSAGRDSAYSSASSNYESYNGMSTEEAARRASGERRSREFYGRVNAQATQSSGGGYYDAEYTQSLASNGNYGRVNEQSFPNSGPPPQNTDKDYEVGVSVSSLSGSLPYDSAITRQPLQDPLYSGSDEPRAQVSNQSSEYNLFPITSAPVQKSMYAQPLTENQVSSRKGLDDVFNEYCQDPSAGFRDDLLANKSHVISGFGHGNVTVKPKGVQAFILEDDDRNSVSMIKNNSGAFRAINFTPGESSSDMEPETYELEALGEMMAVVNARINSLKQEREAATPGDQGQYEITTEDKDQDRVIASQGGVQYAIPMEDDADAPALPMKASQKSQAQLKGGDRQEGVDQIYSTMSHSRFVTSSHNDHTYMNYSKAPITGSQRPGNSPSAIGAATLSGTSKSKDGGGRDGSR